MDMTAQEGLSETGEGEYQPMPKIPIMGPKDEKDNGTNMNIRPTGSRPSHAWGSYERGLARRQRAAALRGEKNFLHGDIILFLVLRSVL